MKLAIIGFVLMIVLMYVLIREKMAPPVAFILLPLIAAACAGFGMEDIAGFVKTGMNSMLSTAILFIFSISYFTLMSDKGLFDPIINFLIKKAGTNVTTILVAAVLTTFVAHLDGSGATTFLIVVPAFLPICKEMGIRPKALLGAMCGAYGVMNIVPWGGPTMRAASVAGVEAGDLYLSLIHFWFGLPFVTVYGSELYENEPVTRAATCPGAGGSEIREAVRAGAQVFITGDISHHEGIDAAAQGMMIIDAGHYGLEHVFMDFMEGFLRDKLPEEVAIKKMAVKFPAVVI